MTDTHNVFVSHIHEDDEKLFAMKQLLATNGFKVRDSSVNSSNPNAATSDDYIKIGILAPRIAWAGTVVVLITPETRGSKWVEWEIQYAQRHDKRIVGVWAHGDAECEMPDGLKEYADAVVGWQADKITGAICGDINNWERPDGTVCPPVAISRHNC
jgi:hypothetical protein